jgi:urease accessory protein
MKTINASLAILALAVLGIAPSQAHDAALAGGAAQGFAHPLSGLDHVLGMVAVGLWAGQQGGRVGWAAPLAFLAAVTAGAGLGVVADGHATLAEWGVLASIVLAGVAVASAIARPSAVIGLMIAAFGLAHGYLHGLEAGSAAPAAFGGGFLAATSMLLAAGAGLGRVLRGSPDALKIGGAAVALSGVALAL